MQKKKKKKKKGKTSYATKKVAIRTEIPFLRHKIA
jgi:hypothetical protein